MRKPESTIHYLSLIKFLVILFAAIGVRDACAQGHSHHAAENGTIRALLVTGGGWHDYPAQEVLLADALRERLDIELTIVHEGDGNPNYHVSVFKEDNWTEGYDVIIHNTAFGRVTDGDFVKRLAESHRGTPAVLIHSANHSYRFAEPADPWFEFTGVQTMAHEDQRAFEVENLASGHPVMKGFPEKWVTPIDDELYMVDKIWGDITPLAQAYGVETETYHVVTWVHEIDGTRVFSTTLGHNTGMYLQKEFLDKIANGLLWAVGQL